MYIVDWLAKLIIYNQIDNVHAKNFKDRFLILGHSAE